MTSLMSYVWNVEPTSGGFVQRGISWLYLPEIIESDCLNV